METSLGRQLDVGAVVKDLDVRPLQMAETSNL
jgi:hypothetical protein